MQPLSEAQKRHNRRVRGVVMRRSSAVGPVEIQKPKARDFLTCVKSDYVPAKPRGRSGCRMSPAKRALVMAKRSAREAFFATI